MTLSKALTTWCCTYKVAEFNRLKDWKINALCILNKNTILFSYDSNKKIQNISLVLLIHKEKFLGQSFLIKENMFHL